MQTKPKTNSLQITVRREQYKMSNDDKNDFSPNPLLRYLVINSKDYFKFI